ncbi:MAG: class I SAM-dependent methyltransferase [wastewater metagenome]|nr:class I SAM-dependent methyltransferase [Candidatus Loosdrechtia aerotolerans]
MKTENDNFYNNLWSDRWGDMQKYGPIHRHHKRFLEKLVLNTSYNSILDVGCGNGENLIYLQRYFPHARLTGIDISHKAFETREDVLPDIRFRELDITTGFIQEHYDLIICFDVLEHIENDLMALKNMHRMANKHLIVSTLEGTMRDFEKEIGHLRNYQKGELEDKLNRSGFKILKKINWGFPFYSPVYRSMLNCDSFNKQTYGQYSKFKIFLCNILYYLFYLSVPLKGDIVFVLAEKV